MIDCQLPTESPKTPSITLPTEHSSTVRLIAVAVSMTNLQNFDALQYSPLWGNRQGEALMISCSPLKTGVQAKLDELFQSGPQTETAEIAERATPRRRSSESARRRRTRQASKAVRNQPVSKKTSCQGAPRSEFTLQLAAVGLVPLVLVGTAMIFLIIKLM